MTDDAGDIRNHPIKRVVIGGGGTSGWMAATLSTLLDKTLDITLVDSGEIGTGGGGEATTVRDAVPYACAIAWTAGWQWRIPLQHRVGNGIAYSSRYTTDDEAREEFLSTIEGEIIKQPWPVRFKPGRRERCREKNCVALGPADSSIEPLESTTIQLIQHGITHLPQNFPQVVGQSAITQYNERLDSEVQHVSRQHHPSADVMSEADLKCFLDDIRSRTLKNVEGLPAHMDDLRSYCPAPAPAR